MTAALCTLLSGAVLAQNDSRDALKSYSFIEAQGGGQLTATDAPMRKLITPTAAFSVGHFFTPVVGARLHVNAWEAKSGFRDLNTYYKWKYITPDLDLMVNLTNLLSGNKSGSHLLNVMLLGGVGLTYAWDNDDLNGMYLPAYRTPLKWNDNRLMHNLRVGLRLETDVTKLIGVSMELNANSKDDRFNSKTNNSDDWQFTAMLGLSVRFGKRYQKTAPEPAPVVQDILESSAAEVAPAPAAVVVKKKVKKEVLRTEPVTLHKEVFYAIRDSKAQREPIIVETANFMKQNKNAKVSIVGYADKGTGNPRVNKKYAADRANKFKDELLKLGVDEASVTVDSKGDTVQPFAENDKNRCVIVDGTAVREYTETIEVEE